MTQTPLRAGDALGRYELLLPIAKGGMAEVWAARLSGTRGFRKIVAVKTILRGTIDDARMEQMFIEEATIAAQIHHPNVVQILEFGEHDEILYLIMEWVEGEPVQSIVAAAAERGGIPIAMSINIVGQALQGLHAAHELKDEAGNLLGVVHRDISPQNLIVSYSGTAKVLDFGIAKTTSRNSTLTEAGEVKGKFAYMSPEQLCGRPLDRRSDVFSIGVLAYMLTTGRHPFRGEHTGETVRNICSSQPALPPSAIVEDFPVALEIALLKALSKEPEDRWATAHELLGALEQAMPECLENTFEQKLSEYMTQLFATRITERRLQLRLAEERSGSGSETSGQYVAPPGSYGSLGAVSMDRSRSGVSSSRQVISAPAPELLVTGVELQQNRLRPVLLAAPVAVLLVGLGVLLNRGVGSTEQPLPRTAASPVPLATLSARPVPIPEPGPLVEPSSDPVSEDSETNEAESKQADATAAAPNKAYRRAPVVRAPARSKAEPPGTLPATNAGGTTPPSAAEPRPNTPPNSSVNAWDPATFGGRH